MGTQEEEQFNRELGKRLEFLRTSNKMTMEHLGARLGVRGQQIYKYELGENRLTPHKLALCANIFNVPVNYFFDENIQQKSFDKTIINIAAEINELPKDVRHSLFALSRVMNKSLVEKCATQSDFETERAA